MRAVIAFVAILVVGGVLYSFLGDGDDIAPPSNGPEIGQERQPNQPERATANRENVTPAPSADDNPKTSQPNDDESPPNVIEAPPVDITVVLDVRNVVTRSPIEAFRWRFVRRGDILRGESAESVAMLGLPRAVVGNLLVEAEGMQPFSLLAFVTPTANEPQKYIDVFLTPRPTGQGITLMVKDLGRQPIPHVRVDAFKLDVTNKESGWDLGQPIWARRADAEDGIYRLPSLPPGDYGIMLVATDEEGNPLALASFRQTFTLNGSNGFLEDVPLEPACALTLDLFDGSNAPFDPKVYGKTSISLNQIGQVGIQRKWTAKADKSGTVSQANAVAGKGRVWLDQPVAPGTYLLEIFVNNDPRVSSTLVLRPEQQTEILYIR